ncbi:DUF6602 domain-containing protein [Bacteroides uniformis]|uniref:DUF6602 domain-containing protein n=1 Tax=Bacteroides uniformis TaxID=820 RepID=UPI003512D941
MEANFNSVDFIKELSEELINGFKKAGKATTPVLVGSAREKEVRNKLELIFPQSIGISTGCVIDSNGNTSKQTDIIIYEKDICPVFSINDTPETTYYPCESVIAVGEIKSSLDTKDLEDSFRKIESVKKNNRFSVNNMCWRKYCSRQTIEGADSEIYNQQGKPLDQIYGFILCEKIGLKIDTFTQKCIDEIKSRPAHLLPNIIVSLNDGILIYLDSKNNCVRKDIHNADSLYFINNPSGNFQYLLSDLNLFISKGRSTHVLPFNKYILKEEDLPGNGIRIPV